MPVLVELPVFLVPDGGERTFESTTGTVRDALLEVSARFPSAAGRLWDEHGALSSFVALYVNSDDVRFKDGLATVLRDGDELTVLLAVAGG